MSAPLILGGRHPTPLSLLSHYMEVSPKRLGAPVVRDWVLFPLVPLELSKFLGGEEAGTVVSQ
jgi:hypothetical protein